MKMISKTKEPFEAPEFEAMEGEVEEEFKNRRTTVRFGGGDDDDHGWSSGSSLSKSALKSIQVKIHFEVVNFQPNLHLRNLRKAKGLFKVWTKQLM